MADNISKIKIPTANKFFSVFLALYPILCIYKGFSKFTVGDIILIGFLAFSLTDPIEVDNRLVSTFIFLCYALMFLLLNIIFSKAAIGTGEVFSLLFRAVKLAFYMLCVFTTGRKYFDFQIFKRTLYVVAAAATAFILFQYFAYYVLGKIFLGQIPGLPQYLDEYTKLDYDTIYDYKFRPSSFFLEPAHFCQYVIVALIVLLFTDDTAKSRKTALAVTFTIGILLTAAAQGLLYLIVVYGAYCFFCIKSPVKTIFFAALALLCAKISYDKIEAVQMAVDRFSNQNAQDARFSSYEYCFSLSGLHWLFGHGYGSTANGEYMAGAAYVWYGCGIIGLLLVFLMFFNFFVSADSKCSKMICLIFFVMFFATSLFYNYMVYWYFSLMVLTAGKFIGSTELKLKNEISLHTGCVQTESLG